ncbi:MAG TPA: TIGR01777 family oxidoreductase [Pseudonocardiaceae bacterium]
MRIAIAGSSGLIGTALVAALRQGGHDVLRLVRRRPAAPDERGWDPPAGRLDDGALDGVGAVVNLCGVGVGDRRWSGAYKQQIRDSRIHPTDVLARAVAEHGVPVLVNASGIGYYGDTGDLVVDESTPRGEGFLAGVCRDWEAATAPAADAGARVVLLRSGLVIARSGGMMGRLTPLFRFMLGGRLGDGRQYFPWVSMDDEVGAIRHAVEHDAVRGPVNVVGPTPLTNAEFTRELARALRRPAPWVIPAFAVRAVLGEFSVEVLTGQRAVPAALERAGYAFQHRTAGAALDAVLGA